jgi:hypothetical protein
MLTCFSQLLEVSAGFTLYDLGADEEVLLALRLVSTFDPEQDASAILSTTSDEPI